jgi:EAL domain-containing protein (putative c-di-GMP-specific phosphodiesterase class I)
VLDRFGSGQGSINALRRFRLRALKLDAPIAAAGDRETDALRPALLALASALALPVAATGIETEEERARLQALGCTDGQGGFFAKPLDAEEAEAILAAGHGALPSLSPVAVRASPSTSGPASP